MNVKNILISRLAQARGEFISGAELSRQLEVSRNAVWKAVKALEAEGYAIESVTAKGYRISEHNMRLSAEIISAENTAESLGGNIIVLSETSSTNTYAKALAADGAVHGTVVAADTQTGGKGRLGRHFESPSETGLYMSVIIRPKFDISYASLITSAAAVAAAESVEKLCSCDVNIKWVNDLYMNGRKICGILTEASLNLELNSPEYAVIGIGINVRHTEFPDELKQRATTVEDESGRKIDRNKLCGEILGRLEYYLGRIEDHGHLDEYRRREMLTGNMISANIGSETIIGKAVGIDDNANLIIELNDGTHKNLISGEANLCRIQK